MPNEPSYSHNFTDSNECGAHHSFYCSHKALLPLQATNPLIFQFNTSTGATTLFKALALLQRYWMSIQ